ncbi:hypothetical protein J3F83DRAFT_148588 [Trichoderma novae-zelandiae]
MARRQLPPRHTHGEVQVPVRSRSPARSDDGNDSPFSPRQIPSNSPSPEARQTICLCHPGLDRDAREAPSPDTDRHRLLDRFRAASRSYLSSCRCHACPRLSRSVPWLRKSLTRRFSPRLALWIAAHDASIPTYPCCKDSSASPSSTVQSRYRVTPHHTTPHHTTRLDSTRHDTPDTTTAPCDSLDPIPSQPKSLNAEWYRLDLLLPTP